MIRKSKKIVLQEPLKIPEGQQAIALVTFEKKLSRNSRHIRVFQDGLFELAKDKDLTGDALRTILGVLSHLEYEGTFSMSLSSLAKDLGVNRAAMSRAVKLLVEKGYLKVSKTTGQVKTYVVDPGFAFKNRVSKLDRIIQEFDKLPDTHPA